MTCEIAAPNKTNLWGCNYGPKPSDAKVLTVITDADNKVVFPANIDSSVPFNVPGFNALTSKNLVFTNFAYPNYFNKGQEIRIWYIDDLRNTASAFGNGGMHCINLYASFL